jgi:two-component system sensor histidine kinase KdpD
MADTESNFDTVSDAAVPTADTADVVEAAGHFRLYLGAAAGVGKTYAMLNEGHRRKQRGTDVVIGFVECHRRPLTEELISDLEVVPRKAIEYRGTVFEEMRWRWSMSWLTPTSPAQATMKKDGRT